MAQRIYAAAAAPPNGTAPTAPDARDAPPGERARASAYLDLWERHLTLAAGHETFGRVRARSRE